MCNPSRVNISTTRQLGHGTGYAFLGVEKIIRETFLPRLFFGKTKKLSPIVGTLITMTIKVAGPGLLNPVTSANETCLRYKRGSAELIRSMTGGGAFSNSDHLRTLGEERCDGQKD